MTVTPRRSARVAKVPERLTPSTTPRKRSNASKASAFSTPKSASSKRQRTARGKSSRSEDSESAVSDSENESTSEGSDEASDFEEARPVRTKTPRKSAAAKAKAVRGKPHKQFDIGGDASSPLLDALIDEKTAVVQVATDWIESYREDADLALCELINLVIRLTGCPTKIKQDMIYETEDIAGLLEELQGQSIAALKQQQQRGQDSNELAGDDMLAGRTRDQRRLRKSVLQFVYRVIVDGQHHIVFAETSESKLSAFMEILLQWLANMGGSSFRPFRHVSTLVTLTVQSALVSLRAHIGIELQTAQRQLEAELKRTSKRRGRTVGDQLRDRVSELTEHDEVAEATFTVFYNTVFVFRHRDVHSMIRAECLAPLATWCRTYPAAYLGTEYLRYLGWALNDRDARVRESAVAAIAGPLLQGRASSMPSGSVGSGVAVMGPADMDDESAAAGIRPFIVRFLPRLVQVAAGDVDHRVQVAALKLITLLARLKYIDATAKIGDIRNLRPQKSTAKSSRRKSKRNTRSTYGTSLSQQMLEESSDEDESDEESEQDDALDIQTLYDDNQRSDNDIGNSPLSCPHHTVLRYLAPLVTHTHTTVRAAAAELVAWWLRDSWVPAARIAALGIDAESTALDGNSDDEDSGGDEEDAHLSIDNLLQTSGGRVRARKWLLFKSVGAFLWHVSRTKQPTTQPASSMDIDTEAWVAEQVAACIEEVWAAPASAVGLNAGGEAPILAEPIAGAESTELDQRVKAAVNADPAQAPSPRLVAAALSLWPRLPELGHLQTLAAYLSWDHSASADSEAVVGTKFALAAEEETALLQAFAIWTSECVRAVGERQRRSRSKKDRTEADDEARELNHVWQGAFVPLLARNMDNAERLLPLLFVAAEDLDLQSLFDANRTEIVEAVAIHASTVLERYGSSIRLVRLAVQFLERVDASRVLHVAAAADLPEENHPAPGVLVRKAASTSASLFSTAIASVPETPRAHASAFADVYAHLVVLRAIICTHDISAILSSGEDTSNTSLEQILSLVELAAQSSAIVQTVPEKAAIAALEVAYRALLWQALRLNSLLQVANEDNSQVDANPLANTRDRILKVCVDLVDADAAGYGRLREHAFMVLGRVLRLFSGSLVQGTLEAHRCLRVSANHSGREQLSSFFVKRLSAWAQLMVSLMQTDQTDTSGHQLYLEAPSMRNIGYARMCGLCALWAQWLGDRTLSAASLVPLAAYTGMMGLEPMERRRIEGSDSTRARRKVGFVALSAFDHIVQAAVDALKPQLMLQTTRDNVISTYMEALRASYTKYLNPNSADPPTDAVNVATLARFIGTALKTALLPATVPATPATPAHGRRGAADGAQQLAPAVLGEAWAKSHLAAIDYGLAQVVPDNALNLNVLDDNGEPLDQEAVQRDTVPAELWEQRVMPWFVALSQTVAGVIRPRHAETLDAHMKRCAQRLGLSESESMRMEDAEAGMAAIASYQRALDKELAKLGAIRARMAEAQQATDVLLSSPPVSPTPMRHNAQLGADDMDLSE
ncbi:cohesin complex subunit [Coemansia brasiliensis]|uniref:Cohesin complex subunit n=1 Tax=Coemansia brasiliensis TaxID=2650707 RepID=A0A9W8M1V6_9FUNG|nr:cohesin complex subunit [Coemansia brasiliensis]